MLGAARLVASELRVNAGEVAHFYLDEQMQREGAGEPALSMPIKVDAQAWRANAPDLMHLADDELRDTLLRLYSYLDRFEREPRLLRPNMHERMREAASELDALARPTWWDRNVLRLSGSGATPTQSTRASTHPWRP